MNKQEMLRDRNKRWKTKNIYKESVSRVCLDQNDND